METNQDEILLDVDSNTEIIQTTNDEKIQLDPTHNDRQQNAFQTIQNKLNLEKEKVSKLEKEINELKKITATIPTQLTPSTKPDNTDIVSVIKTFEDKLEAKLGVITNQIKQQEIESKEEKLITIVDEWSKEYGLSKSEAFRFFENLDVKGTNFENSFEGRRQYALSLVDYPKLLEIELNKVSPITIQKALERKTKLLNKNINKINSTVIRPGQFNTNINDKQNTAKLHAKQIVNQFLNNDIKPVKLEFVRKCG